MNLDIFNDDEFKQQPYDVQQKVANNFFDNELADDEFKQLPIEQQSSIKLNFTNKHTRTFDEIMYEPQGNSIFGLQGEPERYGDTVDRKAIASFPDAQEGSTQELQKNIRTVEDEQRQSQAIGEFYDSRVNATDKALNIDSEHYSKAPVGVRLETALKHFNENIADEEFELIPDADKASVLNNYFNTVVKPKEDELQYQHNFMNGILNFADKSLHTITGNEDYRNLSIAREYQQSKDKTALGQVGWMGGSVAPYLAGGFGAGAIRGLTPALLTDSAIQAGLTTLEHGRSDEALDSIARDIAIDTAVNGLTFGLVRKFAKGNLAKGDYDKASQQLFGKSVDTLDDTEMTKLKELEVKSKLTVAKANKDITPEEVASIDDILTNPDAMVNATEYKGAVDEVATKADEVIPEAKADTTNIKGVEVPTQVEAKTTDEMPLEVAPDAPKDIREHILYNTVVDRAKNRYSKDLQNSNQRVTNRSVNHEYKDGEGWVNTVNRELDVPNHNFGFQLSRADVGQIRKGNITPEIEAKIRNDINLMEADPKWADDVKAVYDEASTMFALGGGNAAGGAMGGGALGGTEALYEDIVEGKDLSAADYAARIAAGAAGGAVLGKKYGGSGNSTNMFVGAKADEAVKKGNDYALRNSAPIDGTLAKETSMQKVQRVIQDKFNRVKQLQKVKAGDTIADDINIYQTEANMHGRAADRMERATKSIIEPLERKIAESGISVDDLDKYLWARHAQERNAKMLELNGVKDGAGMSDEVAQATLRELSTPQMQQIAKYVDTLNAATIRLIEKEGLETPEYIEMLKNSYKHYVPLKREVGKDTFGGTGKGFDIKGKEFKRAKGSDLPVESPLVHSILQFQKTLVRAEKNKVGKTFLKFAEQFPDESLYKVKSVKYLPQYDDAGEIVRMNPNYDLSPNVMHVKVDGKIKEITFKDEALARGFKNLGSTEMGAFMRVAHKMVRFLASVSTQYNPEFVLSNFTRDIQTAVMNVPSEIRPSRTQMVADVGFAIRGIKKSLSGKDGGEWAKLFEDMKASGGTTGWMDQYSFDNLKAQIQKDLKLQTDKGVVTQARKAFSSFIDGIDDVNTAVENGVRLVTYKQALKAGMSKAKAANIAKELTVNFNKKGEIGTALNTAYMFFNASIQGSTRMLKALAKNKVAQGGAVGLASLGAILDYYNNSVAPDEWRRMADYKKDTNLVLMKEDGTHYSIPLPYGYNVFKTLGEIGSESFRGESRDIGSRALGALVSAFSPIGANEKDPIHTATPTLAKLPYELSTNQNFFGGMIRPEETYKGQEAADAQHYFKSVNPLARNTAIWLNEATGGNFYESGLIDTSPENLEHATEFIGGGLGKFIMRTQQWATQKATGDETEWNKVPFARRFYGEPHEQEPKSSAYNYKELATQSPLTPKERSNFEKDLDDSIKNGTMDKKKALEMRREMEKAQIKIKWAKKFNIQDKPTKEQDYELKRMIFLDLYRNKKYGYGSGTVKSQARILMKLKSQL